MSKQHTRRIVKRADRRHPSMPIEVESGVATGSLKSSSAWFGLVSDRNYEVNLWQLRANCVEQVSTRFRRLDTSTRNAVVDMPPQIDKCTTSRTSLKVTVIVRNYRELCSAFSFSSRRSCVSFPVSWLHPKHHRSLRSPLSELEG
jgi:hypothetical protein